MFIIRRIISYLIMKTTELIITLMLFSKLIAQLNVSRGIVKNKGYSVTITKAESNRKLMSP